MFGGSANVSIVCLYFYIACAVEHDDMQPEILTVEEQVVTVAATQDVSSTTDSSSVASSSIDVRTSLHSRFDKVGIC